MLQVFSVAHTPLHTRYLVIDPDVYCYGCTADIVRSAAACVLLTASLLY
jgi:hypothetical protein